MTPEERAEALQKIAAEIAPCQKCQLHTGRTHTVPGAGRPDAEIMFIGEGPGYNEDKQGLPFVGQSGHLLEEFLKLIGLNRDQVFIGNVVKCRPPGNRDPLPDEVKTCTEAYLYRQIEIINPKVVATLGRYSMGLFFPTTKISTAHGNPKFDKGRFYLPLFHPAYILRNMAMKPAAEADFRKIPELIAEWDKRMGNGKGAEPPPEPPKQMSLF